MIKLKLDENIGNRGKQLLKDAGYDVETVVEENLTGASDSELIAVCQQENRCLVTLDLDFSNPIRFKPSQYSGIAVLRLPRQASHLDLIKTISTLILALQKDNILGKLWIVEEGGIRIYQDSNDI